MFGYPAAFSRGLMVACVFQDRIMVRLDEHDWHEAMQLPGGKIFEVMPGRPMKEYVQLPPPVLADPAALGAWVERVVAYAATLPRKDRPRLA
jgi:TfoX/Sxy family transcriptional regulator of competence genes